MKPRPDPSPLPEGADSTLVELCDEIANRVQAGDHVDIDAYVARCPQHADALRRLFPAVHALAELRPDLNGHEDFVRRANSEGTLLGDFRLIRAVGRGGMGTVYEAFQLSLGRRVALKLLTITPAMDDRQLQRFRNEAHAAAQLQHPHIVKVFAVGCTKGLHYYAMQFVDGESLGEVITSLRRASGRESGSSAMDEGMNATRAESPPSAPLFQDFTEQDDLAPTIVPTYGNREYFQTIARFGVQAAEALDHAHQHGVIHRDVKPANLILDPQGNIWVTDFGLAHVQGDVRLTHTGDLVGTPRYMSPEQARADCAVVDQRTDVYSLGATLYELLTLEPAIPGDNARGLVERILVEEPRRPRRVEPRVPRELDTIVRKAIEKRPEDRYVTARELAEDLARFLEHRPLRAKPPTPSQRLAKWARRHHGFVWAAFAVLSVAVIASAISIPWILHERQAAIDEGGRKETQRQRAETSESIAQEQRKRAQQNLYGAIQSLDGYLHLLDSLPDSDHRKAKGYQDILPPLLEFVRDNEHDLTGRRQTAKVFRTIGHIRMRTGELPEAEMAYRKAATALEGIAHDFANHSAFRTELLKVWPRSSTWTMRPPGQVNPEPGFATGAVQWSVVNPPTQSLFARELAACYDDLGAVLRKRGEAIRAADCYRRATELFDNEPGLAEWRYEPAMSQLLRAESLESAMRPTYAAVAYLDAVERWRKLVSKYPQAAAWHKRPLIRSQLGLARVYAAEHQASKAAAALVEALQLAGRWPLPLPN